MSSTNLQLIQGLYNAFASGDIAGVLDCMSPDIIWNEAENHPYADGNPYVGPDAVVQGVFARCVSEWDGFAVVIEEILDTGKTVIMLGRYRGTYRATGRLLNCQVVHVWQINNGRADQFQQYADTLAFARVLGSL